MIQQLDEISFNLMKYLILTGLLVFFVLIIYIYYHISSLYTKIETIEFLLTLIPYDKLTEITTL